jgi:hypothetical protein
MQQIVSKIMTREAYDSARLDSLALRLLDLAGQVRHLAQAARAQELPSVELHDRKALEWIEKLEQWAVVAGSDVDRQAKLAASARKAQQYR